MVVLYMARGYNFNTPAGPGDESLQFYNRAFRIRCDTALTPCVHHAALPFSRPSPSHLPPTHPCPQPLATPS